VEHGRTPSTGEGIRIHTALATYRAGALGWLGGGLVALALAVAVPLPALAVLALVVGGGTAAVIGLGALVRAVRWRRAVAGGDWRPGRLRLAGPVVAALEPEGYDELRRRGGAGHARGPSAVAAHRAGHRHPVRRARDRPAELTRFGGAVRASGVCDRRR
jgi:hypothetical protein